MPLRPLFHIRYWLTASFVGLCLTTPALANMASPVGAADPVGEPLGDFQRLAILQETLAFDLRSLTQGSQGDRNHARITATYQIQNSGQPATVKLLFVAPGIAEGEVKLDGQPIAAKTVVQPNLPKTWQAPETVPSIWAQPQKPAPPNPYDTMWAIASDRAQGAGLEFIAPIPTGDHAIQVSYRMRPGSYDATIYRDYQIGYVLAPAKSWASFGKLETVIQIPAGWQVATSLPMQQSGNALSASFNGIPADTIGITVRPPLAGWRVGLSWGIRLSGWLLGGAAAIGLGKLVGQQQWRGWLAKLLLLPIALLGGSLFVTIALLGNWLGLQLFAAQHLADTWKYLQYFVPGLLLIPGFLIISLATLWSSQQRGSSQPAVERAKKP